MRVLKIIGIALVSLALVIGVSILIFSEKEPVGTNAAKADQLAEAMLKSVNNEAWESTRYITWSFMDIHHYLWDKQQNLVQVKWSDNEVILFTQDQSGMAFEDGKAVEGDKKQKLLDNAWSFFCNDSFWLNPVAKAFDPGTTRSLVTLKDGREGLKVKYESGGVTPGDAYVWILDENNRPLAWKMWTKIVPVGGVEVSWENWQQLPTGAYISTFHKGLIPLELKNITAGMTLESVGMKEDPFRVR